MNAYRLPAGRLVVPTAIYTDDNGAMGDTFQTIEQDHPDFKKWLPFVTSDPFPAEDGEELEPEGIAKAYDALQPRWPEGTALGGQWKPTGKNTSAAVIKHKEAIAKYLGMDVSDTVVEEMSNADFEAQFGKLDFPGIPRMKVVGIPEMNGQPPQVYYAKGFSNGIIHGILKLHAGDPHGANFLNDGILQNMAEQVGHGEGIKPFSFFTSESDYVKKYILNTISPVTTDQQFYIGYMKAQDKTQYVKDEIAIEHGDDIYEPGKLGDHPRNDFNDALVNLGKSPNSVPDPFTKYLVDKQKVKRNAIQFVDDLSPKVARQPERETELPRDNYHATVDFDIGTLNDSEADYAPLNKNFRLSRQDIPYMMALPDRLDDGTEVMSSVFIMQKSEDAKHYVLEASYKDRDNVKIGRSTRALDVEPDGTVTVENELLEFEDRYMNRGLADDLYDRQIKLYKEAGFKRIVTYANLSVGRYAWAKRGFDYDSNYAKYADNAPTAERITVKFPIWARKRGIPEPKGGWPVFHNAYEVATYRIPGVKLDKEAFVESDLHSMAGSEIKPGMYEVGKAFMLDPSLYGHGSWKGVYRIDPGDTVEPGAYVATDTSFDPSPNPEDD